MKNISEQSLELQIVLVQVPMLVLEQCNPNRSLILLLQDQLKILEHGIPSVQPFDQGLLFISEVMYVKMFMLMIMFKLQAILAQLDHLVLVEQDFIHALLKSGFQLSLGFSSNPLKILNNNSNYLYNILRLSNI